MSSREELLALMQVTADAKPIPVVTKSWGTLYVKPPTVEEVDESSQEDEAKQKEDEAEGKKDRHRFARSAARVICDAEGTRVFDVTNPDDINLLAKQPWGELQKVLAAAKGEDAEGN